MNPARPWLTTRPWTRPAEARPCPDLGSTTVSSAARISSWSGWLTARLAPYCGHVALARARSHIRPGFGLHFRKTSLPPWNDNANPGPWGSPPGGDEHPGSEPPPRQEEPRRRLPPPPPPMGPDLGEVFRRLRAEWARLLRGRRGQGLGGSAFGAGVGIVVMVWLLTGFYIVQPYQEAIVTRFGAFARRE